MDHSKIVDHYKLDELLKIPRTRVFHRSNNKGDHETYKASGLIDFITVKATSPFENTILDSWR